MAFNANFDPMQVSLGAKPPSGSNGLFPGDPIKTPFSGGKPGPYMPLTTQPKVGKQVVQQPQQQGVNWHPQATLGAQAVRATGQGPYDPTFRQNLATYAGGQFARPGGNLSFNPTGTDTSQLGANNSLLSQALGGQGFQFAPPPPQTTKPKKVGRTRTFDDVNPRSFGMMR